MSTCAENRATQPISPMLSNSPSKTLDTFSPYAVIRVAGLPLQNMLSLSDPQLDERLEALLAADDEARSQVRIAMGELFGLIGTMEEKPLRNRLLELRRALASGKKPNTGTLTILESLAPCIALRVQRALRTADEVSAAEQALRDRFEVSLNASRRHLRGTLLNEDLQSGLALSSPTLFRNLPAYLDVNSALRGARFEHVERGLLRYASRMATKATPFSKFCTVLGARIHTNTLVNQVDTSVTGHIEHRRSTVVANKRILRLLWGHLCNIRTIRRKLQLEVNRTLELCGTEWRFMSGKGSMERFHRIQCEEALGVVIHIIREKSRIECAELVERIVDDASLQASHQEAEDYIHQLIEVGLLLACSPIPEQESAWSPRLRTFLNEVHDPQAKETAMFLTQLEDGVARYEDVAVAERSTILAALQESLLKLMAKFGTTGWRDTDLILYDDTTAAATIDIVLPNAEARIGSVLHRYVRAISSIAGVRGDMATMRHFFEQHYAIESKVPLLTFYEDYYRDHLKERLILAQNVATEERPHHRALQNPFSLPFIDRIADTRNALLALVREQWKQQPAGCTEMSISSEQVSAVLTRLKCAPIATPFPIEVFGQFFRYDNCDRFVLRRAQVFSGYGKYMSRFLYLLSDEWLDGIRQTNKRFANTLLAEISGDDAFNANLHPPLLPALISYPTHQCHATDSANIDCSDLCVRSAAADPHALILEQVSTGAQVTPVDLGFLNPQLRPALYQLLSRFTPGGFYEFPLPESPTETQCASVVHRPRILYEDQIVLARESWFVPGIEFPHRQTGETWPTYFVRLNRWRHTHHIPRYVFATVRPFRSNTQQTQPIANGLHGDRMEPKTTHGKSDQASTGPERSEMPHHLPNFARPSRDYRKPQFIDFINPLFTNLFAKLPTHLAQFSVLLEEYLPAPNDQLRIDKDVFASELILELIVDSPSSSC